METMFEQDTKIRKFFSENLKYFREKPFFGSQGSLLNESSETLREIPYDVYSLLFGLRSIEDLHDYSFIQEIVLLQGDGLKTSIFRIKHVDKYFTLCIGSLVSTYNQQNNLPNVDCRLLFEFDLGECQLEFYKQSGLRNPENPYSVLNSSYMKELIPKYREYMKKNREKKEEHNPYYRKNDPKRANINGIFESLTVKKHKTISEILGFYFDFKALDKLTGYEKIQDMVFYREGGYLYITVITGFKEINIIYDPTNLRYTVLNYDLSKVQLEYLIYLIASVYDGKSVISEDDFQKNFYKKEVLKIKKELESKGYTSEEIKTILKQIMPKIVERII